ncbi:MAG: aspartate kinase [Coriobacteriales bacterium]|nr:aspartate kinase [Coriobacteriales bacterium]
MKFGGTSVGSREGRAQLALRVRDEIDRGSRPVVVVSALGRRGDPYATDTLLSLVEQAHCGKHELDLLMSVGETISAVVVTALLEEEGIAARTFTSADSGLITDDTDGNASIRQVDVSRIKAALANDIVAVVAGFQGVDEDGILHTLGRGGSDTTACALGIALKADRVDIYTDVDGVFTADPRLIEEATVLETITADELFQMAQYGSKVVHAPAAELALQSGVRMRVRNTFSEHEGTEVVSLDCFRPDSVATAVSTIADITRLRIRLPYVKDDAQAHMDAQTRIYRLMAEASISIDMFTPMNDRLVFSIMAVSTDEATAILTSEGFEVAVRRNLGKVTLVGSGMHGIPGVMARAAQALREKGVDILQVADSHATISLLVDESDLILAAQVLHRAFGL